MRSNKDWLTSMLESIYCLLPPYVMWPPKRVSQDEIVARSEVNSTCDRLAKPPQPHNVFSSTEELLGKSVPEVVAIGWSVPAQELEGSAVGWLVVSVVLLKCQSWTMLLHERQQFRCQDLITVVCSSEIALDDNQSGTSIETKWTPNHYAASTKSVNLLNTTLRIAFSRSTPHPYPVISKPKCETWLVTKDVIPAYLIPSNVSSGPFQTLTKVKMGPVYGLLACRRAVRSRFLMVDGDTQPLNMCLLEDAAV